MDAAGVTTTYSYDDLRRLSEVKERDDLETRNFYHHGTRRRKELLRWDERDDEFVPLEEYEYGDSGRIKTVTRESGSVDEVTEYEYNYLGQVTSVSGNGAYPVDYTYDSYGRLSEQIQYRADNGSLKSKVTWEYDDTENTGLLVKKRHYRTSTANDDTDFDYNDLGQLKRRTWDRGVYTDYGYDANTGELLSETHSDTTADVDYTYDRLGRLYTVDDYTGVRTFDYSTYNDLNLTEEILPSFYAHDLEFDYASTSTTTDIRGSLVDYSYGVGISDAVWELGRDSNSGRLDAVLADVDEQGAKTFSIQYDSDSNHVSSIGYKYYEANREYESDREGRRYTETIWDDDDNDVRSRFEMMDWEDQGRIERYSLFSDRRVGLESLYRSSGSGSIDFDLTYDARGQLTSFDRSDSNTHDVSAYEYDSAGNPTKFDYATKPDVTYNSYNYANQSTSNGLVYDSDGNLSQDASWYYYYDAYNRLKSMKKKTNDQYLRFYYDYVGRRVLKEVYSNATGTGNPDAEVKFLYSGMTLIAELDGSGNVLKSFHWGPDQSDTLGGAGGAEGLVYLRDWSYDDEEGDFYPSYDLSGNLVGLVGGDSGLYEAWYAYDPFGNVVDSGEAYETDNPIGFSTQYTDRETGLVYYGLRYYSPERGRFLNRDPIGESGGSNLYRFAGNDPVQNIDLWGLLTIDEIESYAADGENCLEWYDTTDLGGGATLVEHVWDCGGYQDVLTSWIEFDGGEIFDSEDWDDWGNGDDWLDRGDFTGDLSEVWDGGQKEKKGPCSHAELGREPTLEEAKLRIQEFNSYMNRNVFSEDPVDTSRNGFKNFFVGRQTEGGQRVHMLSQQVVGGFSSNRAAVLASKDAYQNTVGETEYAGVFPSDAYAVSGIVGTSLTLTDTKYPGRGLNHVGILVESPSLAKHGTDLLQNPLVEIGSDIGFSNQWGDRNIPAVGVIGWNSQVSMPTIGQTITRDLGSI